MFPFFACCVVNHNEKPTRPVDSPQPDFDFRSTLQNTSLSHYTTDRNSFTQNKPDIWQYPQEKLFLLGFSNKIFCKIVTLIFENEDKQLFSHLSKKINNAVVLDIMGSNLNMLNNLTQKTQTIYTISKDPSGNASLISNQKLVILPDLNQLILQERRIDVVMIDLQSRGNALFADSADKYILNIIVDAYKFSQNLIILLSPNALISQLADLLSVIELKNDGSYPQYNIEIEEIQYGFGKTSLIIAYFGLSSSIAVELEREFFYKNYMATESKENFESEAVPLMEKFGSKEILRLVEKFERKRERLQEKEFLVYLKKRSQALNDSTISKELSQQNKSTYSHVQNTATFHPQHKSHSLGNTHINLNYKNDQFNFKIFDGRDSLGFEENGQLKSPEKNKIKNQKEGDDNLSNYSYSSRFLEDFAASPPSQVKSMKLK